MVKSHKRRKYLLLTHNIEVLALSMIGILLLNKNKRQPAQKNNKHKQTTSTDTLLIQILNIWKGVQPY